MTTATNEYPISRLGKRELAPYSKHTHSREEALLVVNEPSSDVMLNVPSNSVTLVESTYDDKILNFEVFKHYMAVLQEHNQIRQLKSNTSTVLCFYSHQPEDIEGAPAPV